MRSAAEAADLLYTFAAQARGEMEKPQVMPGPTGEQNELSLHPRGVFVCVASAGSDGTAHLSAK